MNVVKKTKLITDLNGKATDVILDIKTFEKMQDDLEEFYLIKEYDKAVRKTNEEHKRGEYTRWDEFLKKRKKAK